MRPGYIALIFWVLAAAAVYGIVSSLRTGVTRGETRSFRIDEEPIGFTMVILGKVFMIGLAIAETLYALGLAGDPLAAISAYIPLHRWVS